MLDAATAPSCFNINKVMHTEEGGKCFMLIIKIATTVHPLETIVSDVAGAVLRPFRCSSLALVDGVPCLCLFRTILFIDSRVLFIHSRDLLCLSRIEAAILIVKHNL